MSMLQPGDSQRARRLRKEALGVGARQLSPLAALAPLVPRRRPDGDLSVMGAGWSHPRRTNR